jgi:hypothetical protein
MTCFESLKYNYGNAIDTKLVSEDGISLMIPGENDKG